MSVVIPYTFVGGAGNKARAAEVNANFQAVAAKFTEGVGGIKDEDISTSAGIKRTKLSTVAGNRITEAQMDDDAVDLRVLKDDATAGSPNAAVNTSNHIKDGIITGIKLAVGTIFKDRLKWASASFNIGILGAGFDSNTDTGLNSATAFPIVLDQEGPGLPGGARPSVQLRLDTTSGKYYIYAWNMSGTTATVNAGYVLYYLQLT